MLVREMCVLISANRLIAWKVPSASSYGMPDVLNNKAGRSKLGNLSSCRAIFWNALKGSPTKFTLVDDNKRKFFHSGHGVFKEPLAALGLYHLTKRCFLWAHEGFCRLTGQFRPGRLEPLKDAQLTMGGWRIRRALPSGKFHRLSSTCTHNGAYLRVTACFQDDAFTNNSNIPVFVMMPVDAVAVSDLESAKIQRMRSLPVALRALKLAGVEGVMVDVWWGVVERYKPLTYDWSIYEDLFQIISKLGLKIQVGLSFHACLDFLHQATTIIGLPLWVTEIGHGNKDIYYRDRHGFHSEEYLSAGVDQIPLFCGRTALQCYEDFMCSFIDRFHTLLGNTIKEIVVGLGPSGELRYPAYPYADGRWRFPGIGEFQCYDKYMMADLREAASRIGKPAWGCSGPRDVGNYNSRPWEAPFFDKSSGNVDSDYGHFFLSWYSGKLIEHADQVLAKAKNSLKPTKYESTNEILLVAKVAGVHWWYRSHSHAAELTAGYYNTCYRDGYGPIVAIFAKHGVALNIPCLEMSDSEQPELGFCSPEGLIAQLLHAARRQNIPITGENSMLRFDQAAFCRITEKAHQHQGMLRSFTFLGMSQSLFKAYNWNKFVGFLQSMHCMSSVDGHSDCNTNDFCNTN